MCTSSLNVYIKKIKKLYGPTSLPVRNNIMWWILHDGANRLILFCPDPDVLCPRLLCFSEYHIVKLTGLNSHGWFLMMTFPIYLLWILYLLPAGLYWRCWVRLIPFQGFYSVVAIYLWCHLVYMIVAGSLWLIILVDNIRWWIPYCGANRQMFFVTTSWLSCHQYIILWWILK